MARQSDIALQRQLRERLVAAGYERPLDIRYIRHENGKHLDAAVFYRGTAPVAIFTTDGETWSRQSDSAAGLELSAGEQPAPSRGESRAPHEPIERVADAFMGIQALIGDLIKRLTRLDEQSEGAALSASLTVTRFAGDPVLVDKSFTPERDLAWRSTEHTPLWSLYWREPVAAGCDSVSWFVSLDKGADGPLHLHVRRVRGRGRRVVTDWMIEVDGLEEVAAEDKHHE